MFNYGRRYIVAGLILAALPFLAVLNQSYKIDQGTALRLPVQITRVKDQGFFPKLFLTTSLNQISTANVAGENNFVPGRPVFVFLAPGPRDIWYPYAVSKKPPQRNCQQPDCLVLRGNVKSVEQDRLSIRYQYEDFTPSPEILAKLPDVTKTNSEVILTVGKDGQSTVKALTIGGVEMRQRKIVIPVELGFTHKTASAAPVR